MDTNYSYLRPLKAQALLKRKSEFIKKDNISAHRYENATILPLKCFPGDVLQFGRGGVLDSDNTYIESSGISRRVGGYYDYSPSETESSTVVYCGYWVKQWGHFLIESVARLWYFLENDSSIDKYIFISEENGPTQFTANYAAFIRLLGLEGKVEIINQPKKYSCVIIPDLAYSRNRYYSDRYIAIFDTIAQNAMKTIDVDKKYPERIYLSRSQFKKAQEAEAGLDLLDNYFSKNGYTILFPEKLSLCEMIAYIRNADICAAESGTVPHNMLFADNGQKLIIIERQTVVNEIQAQIDIIRNLYVTYIDAHYTIYPVNAGYGPYYFAYNSCLKSFTNDSNYLAPDDIYLSPKATRRNLRKYMRVYKTAYGYMWGFEYYQLSYADSIYEAYLDTLTDLGPYLNRTKAFSPLHYFQIHYIKQLIKQMIHR